MNDPITRQMYQSCHLCPRMCGIDRSRVTGFCGCGDTLRAARAALHQWEEPCLSGAEGQPGGSGTVFFSGCTLRCLFCQNYRISSENFGKELTPDQLAAVFLDLQAQGAHNLNLVTATQYLPDILEALDQVKDRACTSPLSTTAAATSAWRRSKRWRPTWISGFPTSNTLTTGWPPNTPRPPITLRPPPRPSAR